METAINERIEAFIAVDRSDPEERIKFNNWLNTLGATIEIYRDQHGRLILDSCLEDARCFGADEASVEALRIDLMRAAWGT